MAHRNLFDFEYSEHRYHRIVREAMMPELHVTTAYEWLLLLSGIVVGNVLAESLKHWWSTKGVTR